MGPRSSLSWGLFLIARDLAASLAHTPSLRSDNQKVLQMLPNVPGGNHVKNHPRFRTTSIYQAGLLSSSHAQMSFPCLHLHHPLTGTKSLPIRSQTSTYSLGAPCSHQLRGMSSEIASFLSYHKARPRIIPLGSQTHLQNKPTFP